jgi:hypothetical protein
MDKTIDMAREAGFQVDQGALLRIYLERFEALVRADAIADERSVEREACAKVCEETEVVQTTYCMTLHDEGAKTLRNAAAAIRERSANAGARGNT